ncbi:uncharacterized protein LOC120513235 [Passer montanus]|uniref:uncharacterized protein LOC120513235 n=1 Tax=Passer montanus TaxID=9160 RepID=UPI00195F8AFE|nr:uncharacterized protein LOC120513235 [Passer montanus]
MDVLQRSAKHGALQKCQPTVLDGAWWVRKDFLRKINTLMWFNAGKNGLPHSALRWFCGKVVVGRGKHFIFLSPPTAQLNSCWSPAMDHRIQGNAGQRQTSEFLPDSASSPHPACSPEEAGTARSFLQSALTLGRLPAALCGLCWPHGHHFHQPTSHQTRDQQEGGQHAAGCAQPEGCRVSQEGAPGGAEPRLPGLTLPGGGQCATCQPGR